MTFIARPAMSQVSSAIPSESTSKRKFLRFMTDSAALNALDDSRGAHAGADDERDEGGLLTGALQLVDDRADEHRAGRTERVTERDRAAVHVDLGGIDVERLQEAQHDGGEGFVDLEEIDVLDLHAGFPQNLLGHIDRTGEHDCRFGTDI